MISPVDVLLYTLACGFGIAVSMLILAIIVVFVIALVDRFVVRPEYERIENE